MSSLPSGHVIQQVIQADAVQGIVQPPPQHKTLLVVGAAAWQAALVPVLHGHIPPATLGELLALARPEVPPANGKRGVQAYLVMGAAPQTACAKSNCL